MHSLCSQPPRRFSSRKPPTYPSVAALGCLLAACQSPSPSPTATPVSVSITAEPEKPVPEEPQPTQPPSATAEGTGFAVDNMPLDIASAGCKGDCPSPYQMASHKKDIAQVQARVDHCTKKLGTAAGLNLTLRASVDQDGKLKNPAFENVEPSVPNPLAECVKDLAVQGKFSPPESGNERTMYAPVTTK